MLLSESSIGALGSRDSGKAQRRRVIVVAPHFAPSNLASVHRSRLLVNHLPAFGWEPIVVTVHHDHYEEPLDWNLTKILPSWLQIEAVSALPVKPFRIVGDIGIRGFAPMLKRILDIVDREKVDFLYIPIPPFFAAPLGRLVYHLRGIPYGIDYIDPWVGVWPGSEKLLTKHWLSRQLSKLLEPFAVKHASLITGVTKGSFDDVLTRNPHLQRKAVTCAMPYGGEPADHATVSALGLEPYLFDKDEGKLRIVYAGSMWDSAEEPLDRVFRSIAANRALFRDVRFYFIGTGRSPRDPQPQIRPIAQRHGIGADIVVEHPRRIPYLDVLAHLEAADAVFIFGSTKPHYTPSKLYQGVLAQKPIFAVLHQESTAASILENTSAGMVLRFRGADDTKTIESNFSEQFSAFREFRTRFQPAQVHLEEFETYSARAIARLLAEALDSAIQANPDESSRHASS